MKKYISVGLSNIRKSDKRADPPESTFRGKMNPCFKLKQFQRISYTWWLMNTNHEWFLGGPRETVGINLGQKVIKNHLHELYHI